MIDLTIHYQTTGSKSQRLAALPRTGDYITADSKTWKVGDVVHSTPTATWSHGKIDVYCIEVSNQQAVELQAAWKAWPTKGEQVA